MCVESSRAVLKSFGCAPIESLRNMLAKGPRLVASIPELDHYGARDDVRYIGPIVSSTSSKRVAWPEGNGIKIFACIRPDTNQVDAILQALSTIDARVVCVAQGFAVDRIATVRRDGATYSEGLLDLEPLLDADVCLTYGAEGTMLRFIVAGVPQLISPWHVEAYMAARRYQVAGCGLRISERETAQGVVSLVQKLCERSFALHAQILAGKTSLLLRGSPLDVIERIVVSDSPDRSISLLRSSQFATGGLGKEEQHAIDLNH
jgi:UDP:flavonoid glycosyltransferase YjiC (YdhE family)